MKVNFVWDESRRLGAIRAESDTLDTIRELFSVENTAAKFVKGGNSFIPKRKYAITPTGRFEPGMLLELVKATQKQLPGVEVKIDKTLYHNIISPVVAPVYDDLKNKLRYYQKDSVEKCLKQGRGTIVLATAGGKTLTMASLIASFYQLNKAMKCLLIVPDLGLVHQTFGDFNEYGVPFSVSKWTGSKETPLNLSSNVIIANLGILQKNDNISWIDDVDVVIIDEVHKLRKDNKVNALIKDIRTVHRFGFTGTLPENLLDQWNVIGKIGPILYERTGEQLEKEKYIAPVKAVILKLNYITKPAKLPEEENPLPARQFRHEIDFLSNSRFRNKVISTICNKLDNNCLVLVNYIEHGERVYQVLKDRCINKKVFFIRGEVEVEDRKKVIELMETQQNIVCVAISKIFSTGINVKQLCYIIFAAAGKAKIKTIQSIGRGRRLHENKEQLILLDIADQLKYGIQHMQMRLQLYEKEGIPFAYKEIYEKPMNNLLVAS